jgi:hypothetical protein
VLLEQRRQLRRRGVAVEGRIAFPMSSWFFIRRESATGALGSLLRAPMM